MLKPQYHQAVISVLVVTNIVLALFNFVSVNTGWAKYVGVNNVALFDIRPIENMPAFVSGSDTGTTEKFNPWNEWSVEGESSTRTETGLTVLQLAKFNLGCYSSSIDGTELKAPWMNADALKEWKEADEVVRTAALHALQAWSGGFAERSVCTCIDDMLFSRMDQEFAHTNVTAIVSGELASFAGLDENLARYVQQYLVKYYDQQKFASVGTLFDPFTPVIAVDATSLSASASHITQAQFTAFAQANPAFYDGKEADYYSQYATTDHAGSKVMSRKDFYTFSWSWNAVRSVGTETEVTRDMVVAWVTKFGFTGTVPADICDAENDCVENKITSEALWNSFAASMKNLQTAPLEVALTLDAMVVDGATAVAANTKFQGKGMANFFLEDDQWSLGANWVEKHKSFDSALPYKQYSGAKDIKYKQDIVQFCTQNAMPQMQTTYEGIVNVNAIMLAGILLVIASLMREFDYKMLLGADLPTSAWHVLWQFGTFALILVGTIWALATWFTAAMKTDDATTLNYRSDKFQNASNVVTVFVNLIYILIIGFEVVWGFMTFFASPYSKTNTEQADKRKSRKLMYDDLHTFLVFLGGWLSIGLGVLLQANYKHVNTCLSWIVIILAATLLQNISNYLEKVYNKLFEFLNRRQAEVLATHDKIAAEDFDEKSRSKATLIALHKFRALMQFIGWSRLFIAVTVIAHMLFIVTLGRESAAVTPMQSLHDGRLLYFAISFFVALCLLDVLCETLPFVFEPTSARYLRMYFVYAYLLYINLTQTLYIVNNSSSQWTKALPKPPASSVE